MPVGAFVISTDPEGDPVPVKTARDRLIALWASIQEPRWATSMQFVIYLAAAAGGAWTLIDPPSTVSEHMGPILSVLWGWGLASGGALGACVVLQGVWWVERVAVIMLMTAVGMYLATAVELNIGHGVEGSRATQITVTSLLWLYLSTRLAWIWRGAYCPAIITRRAVSDV